MLEARADSSGYLKAGEATKSDRRREESEVWDSGAPLPFQGCPPMSPSHA